MANSPSKTFNLAGLHIANLFINSEEVRKNLANYTGYTPGYSLNIAATIAAYSKGDNWLKQSKKVIDENVEYITNFIDNKLSQLKYHVPEATYLMWIDFGSYGDEEELLEKLAEKGHIILEGGSMFGKQSQG